MAPAYDRGYSPALPTSRVVVASAYDRSNMSALPMWGIAMPSAHDRITCFDILPMSRLNIIFSNPAHHRGNPKFTMAPMKAANMEHHFDLFDKLLQNIIAFLMDDQPYFTVNLYDYLLSLSHHLFDGCSHIALWVRYSQLSFPYSPTLRAHYISLQLSRTLFRQHDFHTLHSKFLHKNNASEQLRHLNILNSILLTLLITNKSFIRWCSHLRWLKLRQQDKCNKSKWFQKPRSFDAPPVAKSQCPDKCSSNPCNLLGDVGGHRSRAFTFDILEPYLEHFGPRHTPQTQLKFVDHVDDISTLNYHKGKYVHTSVPLTCLFMSLPLAHA
jgi:hypothetical protein